MKTNFRTHQTSLNFLKPQSPNLTSLKFVVFLATLILFNLNAAYAQQKERLLVMPVDIIGMSETTEKQLEHISGVARLHMELSGKYNLLDRYEMQNAKLTKEYLKIAEVCLTNACLIERGKAMNVDKVLSGFVENLGPRIIVNFQLIDIKTENIEKRVTKEFLSINNEVDRMVEITLNDMLDIPNNQEIMTKLTKRNDYDNIINNPYQLKLRADGPRMGLMYFTGSTSDILQEKNFNGGYDAFPLMFQFGYQFEKQYLNEGNFQALAEFIPMVTGFDQGLFIPSFTFLNGFRSNKKGWEIAFGPSFNVIKKSYGYYDDGQWTLITHDNPLPEGYNVESRMDSRGIPKLNSAFVIAVGRTFKSGKLNIPINGYIIPQRTGIRFGFSFGFNAKNRYVQ